jgi:hypothetical protein
MKEVLTALMKRKKILEYVTIITNDDHPSEEFHLAHSHPTKNALSSSFFSFFT